MHNHNNGKHKGMMWMMVPCLLLLGVLFFSGGKLSSSWYLWLIIIGVCVGPHIWMMLKGHGNREENDHSDASRDNHQHNDKNKS